MPILLIKWRCTGTENANAVFGDVGLAGAGYPPPRELARIDCPVVVRARRPKRLLHAPRSRARLPATPSLPRGYGKSRARVTRSRSTHQTTSFR